MRKIINLNYSWYFKNSFNETYLKDYASLENFEIINIPHNSCDTKYSNFDECKTMICSTYKKIIKIKKEYEGFDLDLIFEGVAHKATIYLNDDFVTIHRGGYDKFVVNINEYVKYEQDNVITIVVDSTESNTIPPFGSFIDFLGYGGIYREVYLEISEKAKILDFYIRTPDVLNSIMAYCDITLNATPVDIILTIYDGDKEVSVNRYNVNREKETLDFDVKNKVNWDINNPKLYKAVVKMYSEKKLLDERSTMFGFREIKITKEGFYLNGKLIKLIGLTRHQSFPYVGYALPKSAQEQDAMILKYELGCNVVRAANYMQSRHFLNKCDEIGLLVLEEIPGWQYIGDEDFQNKTIENVEKMIKNDRQHPSIIMWGVRISESVDNHELYKKTNDIAHSLDSERVTYGVRNFFESEFLEDIFGFNNYGKNKKSLKPSNSKTPFLITSHNGHMFPAKRFDHENHRIKHALKHLEIIEEVNGSDNIIGATGAIMADFNCHKDFGSSDKICYYGVLDMFRIPKYASFAYKSQNSQDYVLEVSSQLARGDYKENCLKKIYIFTNCEYVKMFKNDDFVETYYPKKELYPNLKNPPIIVEDMVGQILERKEKISTVDSDKLKKIMKKAINNEFKLSFFSKLKVWSIMRSYKRPSRDIYSLFIKYVVGEANKDFVYRFDGYSNENVVKSVTIKDIKETHLELSCDNDILEIDATYDVTRFVIRQLDQDNNLVNYGFDPINIKVSGGIDLIGPSQLSLLGGAIGFWVKTNQTSNTGVVEVTSGNQVLNKTIEIKDLNKISKKDS